MIVAKVKDRLFHRWLVKCQTRLPIECNRAVRNVVNYIDTKAMQNLQDSLGTGYTQQRWGHSDQQSIKDSKVITDISTPIEARYRLAYTSNHAWIVEHGGIGSVTSSGKPFPIGKSNYGQPVAFRQSFKIQRGYHYLENAVNSPDTQRFI